MYKINTASLRHINVSKGCPDCKSQPVQISVTGVHANGEQKESVRYNCGRVEEWVPNFSQLRVNSSCTHGDEYRLLRLRCDTLENEIKTLCKNNGVKHDVLNYILRSISPNIFE